MPRPVRRLDDHSLNPGRKPAGPPSARLPPRQGTSSILVSAPEEPIPPTSQDTLAEVITAILPGRWRCCRTPGTCCPTSGAIGGGAVGDLPCGPVPFEEMDLRVAPCPACWTSSRHAWPGISTSSTPPSSSRNPRPTPRTSPASTSRRARRRLPRHPGPGVHQIQALTGHRRMLHRLLQSLYLRPDRFPAQSLREIPAPPDAEGLDQHQSAPVLGVAVSVGAGGWQRAGVPDPDDNLCFI